MKFWQEIKVEMSVELAEAIHDRMVRGSSFRLTSNDLLEDTLPEPLMEEAEKIFEKHGSIRIEL